MKIHSLHHYPVKGLAGHAPTELRAEARGFADDRRWMLVAADGRFLSQREHAKLALWNAALNGDDLLLSRRDGRLTLRIPEARAEAGPPVTVTVWDDTFTARLVPTVTPTELKAALGIDCRLVYMSRDSHRPVDPRYAPVDAEVSFADGFPFLVTNTASLAELNRRAGTDWSMGRFRPNIVIAHDTAFAEDTWQELQIGSTTRLRTPKPCARCIVVTIDPETSEKDPAVLAELAQFRQQGRKILFGMNAYLLTPPAILRVGDAVHAVTTTDPQISSPAL